MFLRLLEAINMSQYLHRKGRLADAFTGEMEVIIPDGGQAPYTRGPHAWQTSPGVNQYRACVADRMRGQKFGSREAVRKAFKDAANACNKHLTPAEEIEKRREYYKKRTGHYPEETGSTYIAPKGRKGRYATEE